MRSFSFLTIHPQFIASYYGFGVFAAAERRGFATAKAVDLRQFAVDHHGSIDAHPYGGGDGMVMRPEPIRDALVAIGRPYVIATSPRGKTWNQASAVHFAKMDRPIAFLCGRFGGIDQRAIDLYVDEEYSVGDFVVSGGELPALLMADSILRLIPGVLGNAESPEQDSFSESLEFGLEHDMYTRPLEFEGVNVPPALTSGNHDEIRRWRQENSRERTAARRPDLLGPRKLK